MRSFRAKTPNALDSGPHFRDNVLPTPFNSHPTERKWPLMDPRLLDRSLCGSYPPLGVGRPGTGESNL